MANHASHAALPYPVKGARFTLLVPYLDDDGDPTAPASADTEISKDNAAAADTAEEVSATSGMDGMSMLTLTGAETNCSSVALNAKVGSGPKATLVTLYPRVLPTLESGTAQAGANGTITLTSGAAAYDLSGCIVKTTGGTGGGGTGGASNQARVITAYNTSTKVATVVPDWETNPSSDTTYDILLTEIGVNAVVGRFLRPTTDGRTLDVAATGEGGLDFNNILSSALVTLHSLTITNALTASNASNSVNLGTDAIGSTQLATSGVQEIRNAITGGAYALDTDANGAIRIVDGTGSREINTNGGAIALVDLVTDITTKTGYRLSATGVDDIWDEPLAAHTTGDTPGNVLNMLTQDTVTLSSDVALGSIVGQLLDAGTAWSYDRTTDSLEAQQAEHDTTQAAIAALNNITAASVWAVGSRTLTALGFSLGSSDFGTDWLTSTGLATSAVEEIRNAITGGAYALNTDASGNVKVSDGTGANQIDTTSGGVLVSAHSAAAKAEINTEMVDVLAVDTYAEPAQGAPPATTTLAVKIGYGYKAWRNKKTQTSTEQKLFNDDASTVDHKATLSDDGTTLTVGEFATGP
jgi:anti-sigma28 factor (negative regulator of flagellin synthesis)